MRLIPTEGEGLIAIFQSNGPHIDLRQWSNAAAGIFAVFSMGAQADETLTMQGVEVRKFILFSSLMACNLIFMHPSRRQNRHWWKA
jgi:hypothetical protein